MIAPFSDLAIIGCVYEGIGRVDGTAEIEVALRIEGIFVVGLGNELCDKEDVGIMTSLLIGIDVKEGADLAENGNRKANYKLNEGETDGQ